MRNNYLVQNCSFVEVHWYLQVCFQRSNWPQFQISWPVMVPSKKYFLYVFLSSLFSLSLMSGNLPLCSLFPLLSYHVWLSCSFPKNETFWLSSSIQAAIAVSFFISFQSFLMMASSMFGVVMCQTPDANKLECFIPSGRSMKTVLYGATHTSLINVAKL